MRSVESEKLDEKHRPKQLTKEDGNHHDLTSGCLPVVMMILADILS